MSRPSAIMPLRWCLVFISSWGLADEPFERTFSGQPVPGPKETMSDRSCSVTPEIHPPAEYPVSSRLWEKVTTIFDDYKWKRSLCTGARKLPSITFHNITMSDGAPLWTIVINPYPFNSRKGAVLCRSPYGPTTQNLADVFVLKNGYVAVLQDDRGTWRSGGEYDLWRNSAQDGSEVLDWMVKQEWSNGNVYTVGASADGISTATLIMESPRTLRSQWFMWMTVDGHDFAYPQGAYRADIIEDYIKGLNSLIHGSAARVLQEVHHHESWSSWWYNLTGCRDISSPELPRCHYQQVDWPIVMSAGWWDLFQDTMLRGWKGLRDDSGVAVREKHVLFVGPLGHCSLGHPARSDLVFLGQEANGLHVAADLASEFFAGDTSGLTRGRIGRVNLFVMGAFQGARRGNYWTSLLDFPAYSATSFFLRSFGGLARTPEPETGSAQYNYDPLDPTPMLGGTNLPGAGKISVCGTADQASRERRPDVVHFDSEVLEEDIAVVGEIVAQLYVGSSAQDTDFVVTLDDVAPPRLLERGSSYLVRYGAVRMRWRDSDVKQSAPLVAGQVYNVTVRMGYTAYIFERGHKLRVSVSSAAAPYYNPNSNTGVFEPIHIVKPVLAHNAVHFGGDVASAIVLPVVRLEDIPRNRHFDYVASVNTTVRHALQYV